MKKYSRTFDGRTYLYSRRFNDKPNAAAYAKRVRAHGYNARVVNWAGGSGVYIGNRKYLKTIPEARQDWLNEIQDQTGGMDFGTQLGSMGFQTVPRIKNVGGNVLEARDIILKPLPSVADALRGTPLGTQYMSTLDKVSTIDEAFNGVENWEMNRLIDELTKDTDFLAGSETADEETMKILAIKNLKEKREEGVKPSDTLFFLEEQEVDLFSLLSAIDQNKPIVANEKSRTTASTFEIGTPMRTGRDTSMLGWGVDPGEGIGRFGMNSNQLARWHVVVTYPTAEGFEERPMYAFDTKEKAEIFANQFKDLGNLRGEYFMDSADGVGFFLPFESTAVNIVKESATQDIVERQDRMDADTMASKLNLPPEFEPSRLKSNVPGQEAVREMIASQRSKQYYENYMEIVGLVMYNAGFGIDPTDSFPQMRGTAAMNPESNIDEDGQRFYTALAIEDWVDENFTTEEIENFNAQTDFLDGLRIRRD
jgi:hypothetical protein